MPARVHVGDTVDFEHTMRDDKDVTVDISSPITLTMRLIKPDGTVSSKTALLVGDGTDGKVHYKALVADIDVQGEWGRQFYIKVAAGEWTGKLFYFIVHRKIG